MSNQNQNSTYQRGDNVTYIDVLKRHSNQSSTGMVSGMTRDGQNYIVMDGLTQKLVAPHNITGYHTFTDNRKKSWFFEGGGSIGDLQKQIAELELENQDFETAINMPDFPESEKELARELLLLNNTAIEELNQALMEAPEPLTGKQNPDEFTPQPLDLVKIKSVTIDQSEGTHEYCANIPKTFSDFIDAHNWIKANLEIARDRYGKHWFTFEWMDGVVRKHKRIDIGKTENNPNHYKNLLAADILHALMYYVIADHNERTEESAKTMNSYINALLKYDYQITFSDYTQCIKERSLEVTEKGWLVKDRKFKAMTEKDVTDLINERIGEDFILTIQEFEQELNDKPRFIPLPKQKTVEQKLPDTSERQSLTDAITAMQTLADISEGDKAAEYVEAAEALQILLDLMGDDEFAYGGEVGEIWITNALTIDNRILSEIFAYPITHQQLYEYYKKQGYEIKESQVHKVTNKDVLQNYRDALAHYIKQNFGKNINWDMTFIPYSVVNDRMIIGSHSVSTTDGKEVEINPNDLFNSFAKGGSVTVSDLNELIAQINEAGGGQFSLGGAYGYQELWAKDKDGNSHRVESGSKKDIYEALIKNRYNKKYNPNYASDTMAKGGSLNSDALDALQTLADISEGAEKKKYQKAIAEMKKTEFGKGVGVGRFKVGVFNEQQLKNKEDKKAIEKAQKETGLTYIDSKIIKKGGKMFMEVYLIPTEEYLSNNKFAKGGSIEPDWDKLDLTVKQIHKIVKEDNPDYEPLKSAKDIDSIEAIDNSIVIEYGDNTITLFTTKIPSSLYNRIVALKKALDKYNQFARGGVVRKSHLPQSVNHRGKTYVANMELSSKRSMREPFTYPSDYIIVEVVNPRLKGKTDLHGNPYPHSKWIFVPEEK